jgi:rare lipoprotein A
MPQSGSPSEQIYPEFWRLCPSRLSCQLVSFVMRSLQLLGAAALLIAGSGVATPALAGSFSSVSEADGRLAIFDSDVAPSWDEKFLRQIPPTPLAQGQQIASAGRVMSGQASWYGPGFYGNRTANGEVFRPGTLTAAHRSLPFGTRVRVTSTTAGAPWSASTIAVPSMVAASSTSPMALPPSWGSFPVVLPRFGWKS